MATSDFQASTNNQGIFITTADWIGAMMIYKLDVGREAA
jgi:hypothetical protein